MSSAKVDCDLEQLPAHLSWMYRELVVTFFICQETRYPKCHRSFFLCFYFFASCSLFAVVMAGDNEALVLYTPPLRPKMSLNQKPRRPCRSHAHMARTKLAWVGGAQGELKEPQPTFWRPPQACPRLHGQELPLAFFSVSSLDGNRKSGLLSVLGLFLHPMEMAWLL